MRLTSPIHWNIPGNSLSSCRIPPITVSGWARSGYVMDRARSTSSCLCSTTFSALTTSFLMLGSTGVPGQSR